MLKIKVSTKDIDRGMQRTMRRIMDKAKYVDIGIQSDEDEKLLIIAGANEFGATINHPGGTPYGYKTEGDAKKGKVRFLKKGAGYMVLGETEPHTIEIPERSYIRSTIDENEDKYLNDIAKKLAGQIIDGNLDKYTALQLMGQKIEGDIKSKMISLDSPANAPSTIRKKGSDNPLINKGFLIGAIRYVVIEGKPTVKEKQ